MAALQDRIAGDMKAALKRGEKERLQVLRMLLNALKQEQLTAAKDDLSEAEEIAVLQKAVKARRDAVAEAQRLGRQDIAAKESMEIDVAQAYLPAMLSGEELERTVRDLAKEVGYAGPKDVGRLMKAFMARHAGRAEGRDVQAVIKGLAP